MMDVGELATEKKRALRRKCRAVCAAFTEAETATASAAICAALCALPQYKAARVVFCFVGTQSEIDTKIFLQRVLLDKKILCVPFCVATGIMQAKQITALTQLQSGAFGIFAPAQTASTVPPKELSLAVLPCLAADAQGNRLGYGGGYYDRYLPQLAPACATVVLCREALILQAGVIPVQSHDVRAQRVLTEKRLLQEDKQE